MFRLPEFLISVSFSQLLVEVREVAVVMEARGWRGTFTQNYRNFLLIALPMTSAQASLVCFLQSGHSELLPITPHSKQSNTHNPSPSLESDNLLASVEVSLPSRWNFLLHIPPLGHSSFCF